MADKYLKNSSGFYQEVEGLVTSAGAGDAGKIPALDGAGRLDNSVMPSGVGADTKSLVASEALAAGDFVSIWDDAGTPKVRKADATNNTKPAHGFVLAGVSLGASATVYFEGANTQLSGLAGGNVVFLSASTPGGVTTTAPSASGNLVQRLGIAVAATEVNTEIQETPVVLA